MKQVFKERNFYIYKFLDDCLPIYALYTILFKEEGLSLVEIGLLLSFWSLVALILELPSGILADRWSRRHMIGIATIFKAICFCIWAFSNTFIMFGLGFLFWGISSALSSGTEEGLIYDNLKSEKREKEFNRIYGRGRIFSSLGTIVAIISSGIFATLIGIDAVSIISCLICFINLIFIYQLKERNYYSERLKKENISYITTFKDAIKLVLGNSKILLAMLFLIFVASITGYMDEFDALIIDDMGLSYIWISVIFTVRFIFITAGNYFVSTFENIKSGIFIFSVIASLFLLAFSFIWHQYALLLFGISCMIMTIVEVIQVNAIQIEIKEEGRTTIMSLYSIGQNILMILFSLMYGALSGIYNLKMVYIIISIYCIVGTIIFYIASSLMKENV